MRHTAESSKMPTVFWTFQSTQWLWTQYEKQLTFGSIPPLYLLLRRTPENRIMVSQNSYNIRLNFSEHNIRLVTALCVVELQSREVFGCIVHGSETPENQQSAKIQTSWCHTCALSLKRTIMLSALCEEDNCLLHLTNRKVFTGSGSVM